MPRILRGIFVAGALLWPGVARLAAENYELAVAAKMTEIKWKQEDLLAAQRELAILSQFLDGYNDKSTQLNNARAQLASADTQLASIQQGNLVKLTIRMGIETYNTVSDTINLGKTAATSLVTHGVANAVGGVAFDQLTGNLTDQGRTALGMDAASLSTPRTVKIQAVTAAARAAYPDLARVQQMLAMSLEGVKAAARMEDPPAELGDTGAILRKNLMVREEIAAALAKLDALGTETTGAKEDADTRLPAAQADVDRITAELATLNNELFALKTLWDESEAAARAAANAAAIVPPVNQPPPSVSVPRGEVETDWEYAARVAAAILAAAQARWDAEAPPLLSAIDSRKSQIVSAQGTLTTAVTDNIENPQVSSFIFAYGGNGKVDANTTASYSGSISSYTYLKTAFDAVSPASGLLSGLVTQSEGLADQYTLLHNLQNQLHSLQQMLYSAGGTTQPAYPAAMTDVGMGQGAAEALAVSLDQMRAQLPEALANAQAQLDQLSAATEAWSSGINAVHTDLDVNLTAAQSALAELIARGTAWDNALAAADGLVYQSSDSFASSRWGYFTGYNFTPVIRHEFSMGLYKTALQAAVATPGEAGLTAALALRAKYDALVAAAPGLKDAYDSALQRYQAAYARVSAYAGYYMNFPILQDWSSAAAFSSTRHPVDASGVTDQQARFLSLYETSTSSHVTNLAGGEPDVGQPVIFWQGLPRLRQLPDPGIDDPAAYLPHRLLAQKEIVVADGPSWIPLAPTTFNANYNAVLGEIYDIQNEANTQHDDTYDPVILAFFRDLSDLYDDYTAAHPKAVISVQPASSMNSIPAGTTFSTTLSVTASGDFLTYEWYETQWPEPQYEYTWTRVPGADSSSYTTPALGSTNYYRVHITNPGGTTVSEVAQVGINQVYPTPVFTSADHATGQVGVPFSFTFTTDISSWISTQGMSLPPGLMFSFMFGRLEGTPTAEGTYDIIIMASNNGSVAMQTFHLTIEPGTLAPFDAWIQQWTTPTQRQNFSYTLANGMPAGDGIANVLKYAFNMLGNGPGQVASLDVPSAASASPTGNAGLPAVAVDGSGRLTVLYLRRKAASQPGITYALEFSSTLAADSWAVNASATEAATSIDDTWERVLVTDSAAMTGARFVRVRVVKP
ncbi:MAG: hypothetical protein IPN11_00380 [Opitutaceae bacterium]|nr:hypothetical protein [Opitutaceae bacterium]